MFDIVQLRWHDGAKVSATSQREGSGFAGQLGTCNRGRRTGHLLIGRMVV